MLILPGRSATWAAGGASFTPVFTEAFTRGSNEALETSANWSVLYDEGNYAADIIASSDVLRMGMDGGTYDDGAHEYTGSLNNNQYALIAYSGTSGTPTYKYAGVMVRASNGGSGLNCYSANFSYNSGWTIDLKEFNTGSFVSLGSHSHTPTAGDVIRLLANGTTISVDLDTGGGFSTVISVTDATHSSGSAGVQSGCSGAAEYIEVDDFECGNYG